jgi:hypothetical protein
MRVVIAVLAVVLASTFIHAEVETDVKAESEDKAKTVAKPNKRSCRKVKVTGHHIKQRVCMTNGAWTDLAEQQEAERRKARALSTNPGNAVN